MLDRMAPDGTWYDSALTAEAEEPIAWLSDSTRRAYTSDLKTFATWCASLELASFPADPQTIALYIEHLKSRVKIASINRALFAIAHNHINVKNPCDDSTVRRMRKSIVISSNKEREKVAKKTAISLSELRAMVKACPDTLRGKRG